jgi:ATP-dependent DNA helicase RecG
MRLDPGAHVGVLPGVTVRRREALGRLGVRTVEDLLRLGPRRYEDRRHPVRIADLVPEEPALVVGRVERAVVRRLRGGLVLHEAIVADDSGRLPARWFVRGWRPTPLPRDALVALYGAPRRKRGELALVGAQVERLPEGGVPDPDGVPGAASIVPVHPLSEGLSAAFVRGLVWRALPAAEAVRDSLARLLPERERPSPLAAAIRDLHFPPDLEAAEAARQRLALEELTALQVRLARRRKRRLALPAPALPVDERLDRRIRARLPFTLTSAQDAAVADLRADLALARPMHRLLQGDVGAGKTAVAVYALLAAVAHRWQGALMAPTDVLVRQHAETLSRLLEGSRVRVETLVGGRGAAARAASLERIAAGEVDLVVGTHAVISGRVSFARLGVVVVDEEHKFGVEQRRALARKGADGPAWPHVLVMTATPIPRTLALTAYADLDVTVLAGRRPGRAGADTWVVRPEAGSRVLAAVRARLEAGQRAIVVYPLVEESETVALRDAVAGRDRWQAALPGRRVGLLHGRLPQREKEAAMAAFRDGAVDVLVSTVVVEVGVDVPEAGTLVVEHAERFGLSQLHQLRGRIGRAGERGLCVLVDRSEEGSAARLAVLAETEDGFRIAEEDLLLRGAGDLAGTRQHGRPAFRTARLPRDLPLLERARRLAARALAAPGQARPRSAPARMTPG